MTANGANMKILWSSSARNDVIFMVIFIFSFCHFLPCTKVFLPAGKIMVKSPVITPHGKNLTTLIHFHFDHACQNTYYYSRKTGGTEVKTQKKV